jgi:hypothetical protein
MNEQRPKPVRAGGSVLAGSILAGTLIGVLAGEASIGFLGGLGVGILFLTLLWLRDRSR